MFNAWFNGWSEEEIRLAFGVKGNLRSKLVELALRIRKAAGVETDEPLPTPKRLGRDPRVLLGLIEGSGEKPIPSRPRFVLPPNLGVQEIQRLFCVSRTTAWRARKRGWLVPGDRIPSRPVPAQTDIDLTTPAGRQFARRQLLGRDGWFVEFGAMWTRCGICGKPALVSVATIDHIIPRFEGGLDLFGNLQLAHYECNQLKGSRLPELLAAIVKPERGLSRPPNTQEV